MKAFKCYFLVLFILSLVPASVVAQGRQERRSVGLVLSGGGAKGIAHVGVLKAFEQNGIPVDYVAGTSMGAIVGGLYACGYSPDEMMELFTSEYFLDMSTGRIDPSLSYYFTRKPVSSQLFQLPLGKGKADNKVFNPQSIIPPMPMAFGFMEMFSPYTAQCDSDFNRLFVPFRCVASDVRGRCAHVMRSGSVGDAIHASMSFPLVFQATMIDSLILYDGGMYDNFPVNVMEKDFNPDFIIGVTVNTPSKSQPNSFMDQLSMLVTEPQSYDVPSGNGIKIHIDCSEYSLLDFPRARDIYRLGYERGVAMIDSIKSRVSVCRDSAQVQTRRSRFKSATPPLRFNHVTATGGTPMQNRYLEYLFMPRGERDTIGAETAERAFYRAVSSGQYNMLKPVAEYDKSSGLFSLRINTLVKKKFSVGLGAFITSTNNSYLYLRADYNSLSFRSLSSSLEGWIGQNYMAGTLKGSFKLHTAVPSAVFLHAAAWRRRYYESEHLFFRENEPDFVADHEYFAKAGFAVAAGRSGAFNFGLGVGRVYNSYINGAYRNGNDIRDHVAMNLGTIFASYAASTLDDINYPTSGYGVTASVTGAFGRCFYTTGATGFTRVDQRFIEGSANYRTYLDISKRFSLGLEGMAVITTRKLLDDYYAAVTCAPGFSPTPAADYVFRARFHANQSLAAGIVPVYKPMQNLSVRLNAYLYAPLRHIKLVDNGRAAYGKWFGTFDFYGELAAVYHLPFANIAAYANYDGTRGRFSGGISLGLYLPAPSFF